MIHHHVIQECLTFLNDQPRNQWYRDRLRELVKDKVVFEIGCGSGILACYALEFGAKHYYGIDIRSTRSNYAKRMVESLGYTNATIWCDDFLRITPADIPESVDILLCEQVGYQFQNDITIQQFWRHANKIFKKPYQSLPDSWTLQAWIYPTVLNNALPEYCAKTLLPDSALPTGFYDQVQQTALIQPDRIETVVELTPANCEKPLSFDLDLTDYKSATVVLDDWISYQGHRSISVSATTDWPGPLELHIPVAGKVFRFEWNSQLRNLPAYRRGFWTWSAL
jgi:SAM-dependent methyltransferase